MPLFGSHNDAHPVDETPQRKSSVFSRSKTPPSDATSTTSGSHSSFFARHSLTDGHKDPSILAARQKVIDAEAAEKAADRALHGAKLAVKEARDHVKNIEREAMEE